MKDETRDEERDTREGKMARLQTEQKKVWKWERLDGGKRRLSSLCSRTDPAGESSYFLYSVALNSYLVFYQSPKVI